MNKLKQVEIGFDAFAGQYHKKFSDLGNFSKSFQVFEMNLLGVKPAVLDLGCGPGNIIKCLKQINTKIEFTGVDISNNMLSIAKKEHPEAIFIQSEALQFLKRPHKYQGIICGFILPYLEKEKVKELITLCASKITPTGVLYLSTMEGLYSESGWQGPSNGEGSKIFIHYHEQGYLFDFLNQNGFNIIHVERKPYQFTTEITNTDLIIVAKRR
jgi:predicted TPR repeat methyltransferase